jgi:hypothetical protein
MSANSIHRPDSPSEFGRRIAARRSRFELAAVAQRVLYDPTLLAALQHRTVWCHRAIKNESGNCHIWRRADGSSARYTGVVTCGSVWTCPVCSARVAEHRREELERGMKAHVAGGGHAYLLTLTFPHERDLPLAEAERLFSKALQKFKNSKRFKRVSKQHGRQGSVRSLEITWGPEHGFHVHTHDLMFAAPGLDTDQAAIDELRSAWIDALLKVGLGSRSKITWMWERALDLRGGQHAADYIAKFGRDAKWGITAEVTRSHAKIGMREVCGHEGHVTPFQLLAWAGAGDAEAAQLFRDFAEVFKHKRMLSWSRGLKAKLGLDESDDAELAGDDTPLPAESEVATLNAEELALVVSRGAVGELLEMVCLLSDGAPDHVQACVEDFLTDFRTRPKISRGTVRQKLWRTATFAEVGPTA